MQPVATKGRALITSLRITVLLALLSIPLSVLAQATKPAASDAELTRASSHFQQGVQLYQEEAYRAALVEFQRAYAIAPDYRLLYNIGQTKLRLQDYLGSVQSYETYLAEGGREIAADRRGQVESALSSLRSRVGRIGVSANRDGAEVFVDDVRAGVTPLPGSVAVNVGSHRVLARTRDGASEVKIVEVAGGDVMEVTLLLETPTSAATPVSAAATDRAWSRMQTGAVTSWALGGALLVGAAVTGGLTWNAQGDLDDLVAEQGASSSAINSKRDSLETLALTTDVLIGAGAAAVVAGTILWLVDRRALKRDQAQRSAARGIRASFGLGAVQVRGHF
jgi:hypothetical protein